MVLGTVLDCPCWGPLGHSPVRNDACWPVDIRQAVNLFCGQCLYISVVQLGVYFFSFDDSHERDLARRVLRRLAAGCCLASSSVSVSSLLIKSGSNTAAILAFFFCPQEAQRSRAAFLLLSFWKTIQEVNYKQTLCNIQVVQNNMSIFFP